MSDKAEQSTSSTKEQVRVEPSPADEMVYDLITEEQIRAELEADSDESEMTSEMTPKEMSEDNSEEQEEVGEFLKELIKKKGLKNPTMEDLAKMVINSEKMMTKSNQKSSELKELVEELRAEREERQEALNKPKIITKEEFEEMMQSNPLETLDFYFQQRSQGLVNKIADLEEALEAQKAINTTAAKFKDFEEYEDAMVEIIEKNPALTQMENGLEFAYKLAKYEAMSANQQQQKTAEAQTRQQNELNKKKANTLSKGVKPINYDEVDADTLDLKTLGDLLGIAPEDR
ncbi:MAG: hypothetical protein ACOYWZ_11100 [Bacillota bacterium]